MGIEAGGVEGPKVERLGTVPEMIKPLPNLRNDVGLVMTKVELDVGGEAGESEVRRSGDHAFVVGSDDKRLAVEERILQSAYLHSA